MRKHKFLSICASVLLSLSVLTTGVLADTAESTASENSTASDTSTSETDTTTNTVVAKSSEMGFPCDKLTDPNSASIYMVSLDTDTVVYTYNPDERRPMASMTKIMTYIVTAETVSDLQNTRTTVPESVAEELEGTGSSLAEIQTGESFTIYELLNLMMVPSGNDAALTLAKYVDSLNITADDPQYDEDGDGKMSCVELMNKKAAELGCTNTHFVNPHGLYDENHYTTAREMATITEYALTMPYFTDVTSQTYYTQPPTNKTSEERTVTTTNRMLLSYDDEYYTYATGVKTGSLNESGYCISATATYDGYSYLVVCMGSPYIDSEGNHIDYHGEMYDAATLFRWAFLNIENKTLVTDGELLGEVSLKYAWGKDRLQVLAQGNLTATLPSSLESGAITTKLDLPESVKAPIKKGDYVGTATFYYNGAELSTVALVAAESVERSEIVQVLQQAEDLFLRLDVVDGEQPCPLTLVDAPFAELLARGEYGAEHGLERAEPFQRGPLHAGEHVVDAQRILSHAGCEGAVHVHYLELFVHYHHSGGYLLQQGRRLVVSHLPHVRGTHVVLGPSFEHRYRKVAAGVVAARTAVELVRRSRLADGRERLLYPVFGVGGLRLLRVGRKVGMQVEMAEIL